MPKTIISEKVMRSYDYCHFESGAIVEIDEILDAKTREIASDSLRKEVARLADKAVLQYKKMKAHEEFQSSHRFRQLESAAEDIRQKVPESERTPEHKAILKKYDDACHMMRRQYDYQDDFEDDPDLDMDDDCGY